MSIKILLICDLFLKSVMKSVSPSIDGESRRVLEQSPKWIPGKQHGAPVRVLYRIPLNFSFN